MTNIEKAKLIIALIGISTSGKTTCIGSLSKEHTAFDKLTESGIDGRSKINSEYEFLFGSDYPELLDHDYKTTIKIKKIEFKYIPRISAGSSNSSIPDSEILALKKEVLTSFDVEFDDSQLEKKKNFDIAKAFDVETIRKIINDTKYDKCIQRITFSLTPTDIFRKSIEKNNQIGCIVLRDTQGLLDLNITADGKLENIKSLGDMGLDGIDGALLFDSEMPVITEKLYKESVRNVLQAVPLFLVKNKNDSLKMLVDTLQSSGKDLFESYNIACEKAKCKNAVDFLERCEISPNVFINETAYQKFTFNSFDDNDEYEFFQNITSYAISTVAKKILNIYTEMDNELNNYNSDAHKEFIIKIKENRTNLYEDIKYFHTNKDKSTEFLRPNIREIDAKSLCNFLEFGSDEAIIGTSGGITTRTRGRMCFPCTAVLGVAGYRFMRDAIDKIEDKKSRQIMHTKLYHCIDNYAMIHGYYHFIDRYMLKDTIENIRKHVSIIESKKVFRILLFFELLVTAFCKKEVDPFKAYEDMKKNIPLAK